MRAKMLIVIVIITILTASYGFSATIGAWYGCPAPGPNQPAVDANKPACTPGTGSWKDAYWNKEGIKLPPPSINTSEEIKIVRSKTVCTLDSNAGNYVCKLSIAGGAAEANAPRLEIVNGGVLGIGEFRVGAGGSNANGPCGCVNQTGGTVNLSNNLILGRYGTSSNNPNEAKGFYTISGGSITCNPTNTKGGLYIAGNSSAGATEGTFTVAGNAANINFKKLYVTSSGAGGAKGTVEFKIGSSGVSPIRVSESVSIGLVGANATARLLVSATAEPPKANILLIDNQGSMPITGTFNTVNGNPATEGAAVVLSFGGNNYNYSLTYKGGAGGNDVMLFRSAQQPAAKPAPAATATPAATPNTPAAPAK
jgi:hypothetical protein